LKGVAAREEELTKNAIIVVAASEMGHGLISIMVRESWENNSEHSRG